MAPVALTRALLLGVLALILAPATGAARGGRARVVMGSPAGTPAVSLCLVKPRDCGWGTVAPHFLWYGGDMSSKVGHRIRWTMWGDHVAFGVGLRWSATPVGGMYQTPLRFS